MVCAHPGEGLCLQASDNPAAASFHDAGPLCEAGEDRPLNREFWRGNFILMRRPVRVKRLSVPSGLFATRYATARFAFAAARRPPAPRLVLRRSRFPPTLIPRQAPDAAQRRRALATRPAPLRAPLSRLASAAAPPQVLPAATRTATSAAAVLGRSKSPAAP